MLTQKFRMLSNIFENYGEFCAGHPWEVIVAVVTLTASVLSMDNNAPHSLGSSSHYLKSEDSEANALDVIFMTIIRCAAVLYSYHQFVKLRKLGSNYILGIAGLFTVFSTFVFSSTVINILQRNVSDLKDALFFFVLVIDLSKASVLTQFALRSTNQEELKKNIARGMGILGPTVTLDTLVGTLVISVATLSGVRRLEMLGYFACFSFIVNYILFMTFYPACVSLVLELSRCGVNDQSGTTTSSLYEKLPILDVLCEEGEKPNPVVQRVKVIMSASMVIVHAHSRWSLNKMESINGKVPPMAPIMFSTMSSNHTETTDLHGYIMRLLSMSTDHIVILILIIALTVKFVFFDEKEDFADYFIKNSPFKGYRKLSDCWRSKICQTEEGDVTEVENKISQTEPIMSTPTEDSSKSVQTDITINSYNEKDEENPPRSNEECFELFKRTGSAQQLTNTELCNLVQEDMIKAYQLETEIKDPERGIEIRRKVISQRGCFTNAMERLPFRNYDYTKVIGACCENVLGYVPIPVGFCGPLLLDGQKYYVPLATTEGCLVASTNRGSRALYEAGGVWSRVVKDGMTRAPVVSFKSGARASEVKIWIEMSENFIEIKKKFDSTSRFAKLQELHVGIVGNYLHIRFAATTGDAMGMNMVSKGVECALNYIKECFEDMKIESLSGNFCTDKKPSAVNWIKGRGKSVVCEAFIPEHVVKNVLKTSSQSMAHVNVCKNLIGSAMAVTIGGYNAHAANIVTAIYIATGQDPAQNVGSSNCITLMETCGPEGRDLHISCTMPSIEVGTVGGGTSLPAQKACLDMLGVTGPHAECPGENARMLARIVCGTVLAGELSLMAALTAGHLVKSHLRYNRTSLSQKSMIEQENIVGQCLKS